MLSFTPLQSKPTPTSNSNRFSNLTNPTSSTSRRRHFSVSSPSEVSHHRGRRRLSIKAIDAAQPYDYEALVSNQYAQSSRLKIAIVGFGNFGQFLAKSFVTKGHIVLGHSRADYSQIANSLGVSFFQDPHDLCEEHPDVIVLCTSIISTETVLRSLPIRKLKRNTLFVDVLSVKEFPKNIFLQVLPTHFDILCTHPMFGPESGKDSWKDLIFMFDKVRIGRGRSRTARVDKFLDIFEKEGCRMVPMTCAEHDKHTAGSLFITHTMGRVWEKLGLETTRINTKGQLFLCVGVGLWAGLIIGFATKYYTSNAYRWAYRWAYSPVQAVADSCRTGAATNVIFGLALGYKSVIIPSFDIRISMFVSFSFAAMYGIIVAALGMLSTIATGLVINAYGPISDNAGGIAEMAGMSHRIRERTDALDAAGNTTAAIGKGFAIGSAALVSLALFGPFVSRAAISTVDVLTPKVFIGLLVGAMLPYWFSAMTMKSVGGAALKMVEDVHRQFNTISGLMEGTAKPDYATCVKISTDASIKEMIPPGALVMLTPLIVGILFGIETLSGVLGVSLISGVQIAISASNASGAWDNAKK